MLGVYHLADLIPVMVVLAVVIGAVVVLGRSIGAGYARARRQPTPPTTPTDPS